MTNLAAVMTAIDTIEVQERPDPIAAAGQAIVRIETVGVCGSDVAYYHYGRIGPFVVEGDIILGHETAGEVIAIGEGVTMVSVGDRVAIEPGTPCRNCKQCMAGRYHLCPDLVFLATPPYDGALVQSLAIDARNLFVLPDSMSYEEGALIEPLSVGLWGCQRAGIRPGDRVLVTGAGPVGLLAAESAKALGASAVTVTDVSDTRLALAARHGFSVERSDAPGDDSFDILLECSGAPGVLADGLARLAPAGRAAVIGISKVNAELPLHTLNWNELTISLVSRYQNTWPLAIALISSGRVNLEGVHTHSFPLDRVADALTIGATDRDAVKAIVYPQRLSSLVG
jgi:L-iditol 2-dehydrogenase